MISEQFENGRSLDGKHSVQDFDAKEVYLHPKNRSVSFQKRPKMFCFHHFQVFTRCCFQNVSVRVPLSKFTVFKICRQKICHFRANGRPIRHNFHRFQNLPASCQRSPNNQSVGAYYLMLLPAGFTEIQKVRCRNRIDKMK